MRRLLTMMAIAAATVLPIAAHATTFTGSFTITETYSDATNSGGGGPVITGNSGWETSINNTAYGTAGNFSITSGGAAKIWPRSRLMATARDRAVPTVVATTSKLISSQWSSPSKIRKTL